MSDREASKRAAKAGLLAPALWDYFASEPFRQGLVLGYAGIPDHSKQLFDTLASHRGDDPELGQMGADGIDHRGLLADEELACAMEHQAALLFGRLGLDKPHVGSGYCFADGLSVGGIILLPLDVGS